MSEQDSPGVTWVDPGAASTTQPRKRNEEVLTDLGRAVPSKAKPDSGTIAPTAAAASSQDPAGIPTMAVGKVTRLFSVKDTSAPAREHVSSSQVKSCTHQHQLAGQSASTGMYLKPDRANAGDRQEDGGGMDRIDNLEGSVGGSRMEHSSNGCKPSGKEGSSRSAGGGFDYKRGNPGGGSSRDKDSATGDAPEGWRGNDDGVVEPTEEDQILLAMAATRMPAMGTTKVAQDRGCTSAAASAPPAASVFQHLGDDPCLEPGSPAYIIAVDVIRKGMRCNKEMAVSAMQAASNLPLLAFAYLEQDLINSGGFTSTEAAATSSGSAASNTAIAGRAGGDLLVAPRAPPQVPRSQEFNSSLLQDLSHVHPSSLGELERKNSSEMRAVLRMAMEKAFSQVNVESQVKRQGPTSAPPESSAVLLASAVDASGEQRRSAAVIKLSEITSQTLSQGDASQVQTPGDGKPRASQRDGVSTITDLVPFRRGTHVAPDAHPELHLIGLEGQLTRVSPTQSSAIAMVLDRIFSWKPSAEEKLARLCAAFLKMLLEMEARAGLVGQTHCDLLSGGLSAASVKAEAAQVRDEGLARTLGLVHGQVGLLMVGREAQSTSLAASDLMLGAMATELHTMAVAISAVPADLLEVLDKLGQVALLITSHGAAPAPPAPAPAPAPAAPIAVAGMYAADRAQFLQQVANILTDLLSAAAAGTVSKDVLASMIEAAERNILAAIAEGDIARQADLQCIFETVGGQTQQQSVAFDAALVEVLDQVDGQIQAAATDAGADQGQVTAAAAALTEAAVAAAVLAPVAEAAANRKLAAAAAQADREAAVAAVTSTVMAAALADRERAAATAAADIQAAVAAATLVCLTAAAAGREREAAAAEVRTQEAVAAAVSAPVAAVNTYHLPADGYTKTGVAAARPGPPFSSETAHSLPGTATGISELLRSPSVAPGGGKQLLTAIPRSAVVLLGASAASPVRSLPRSKSSSVSGLSEGSSDSDMHGAGPSIDVLRRASVMSLGDPISHSSGIENVLHSLTSQLGNRGDALEAFSRLLVKHAQSGPGNPMAHSSLLGATAPPGTPSSAYTMVTPDQSNGSNSSSHAYQQQQQQLQANLGCTTVSDAGAGMQTLGVMHHASHASHPQHFTLADVHTYKPLKRFGQPQWFPEQQAQQHFQGKDTAAPAAQLWEGHQGQDFDVSNSAGGSSTSSVAEVVPLPKYDNHGNVITGRRRRGRNLEKVESATDQAP